VVGGGVIVQWLIVGAVLLISLVLLAQRLVPLALRIKLAHQLHGKVSDRIRIWLVGRVACGQCGPKP